MEDENAISRDRSLRLLLEYQCVAVAIDKCEILHTIRDRFPTSGCCEKAARWVGFAQGVLFATGVYTLDELKEHSRNGSLRPRS